MRIFSFLLSTALFAGCVSTQPSREKPDTPDAWQSNLPQAEGGEAAAALEGWWHRFDDPTLDALVELALEESPDRRIAAARIREARGLLRTNRAALLPKLSLSGTRGEEDIESDNLDFSGAIYDAGFDASFELDIFGRKSQDFSAAKLQTQAAEARYQDASLSLIGEVARVYIQYCAGHYQQEIAQRNLEAQQETLRVVEERYRLGDAPQLDVERARNLVFTTQATIPEFQRQAENARLQLSVLTGSLPIRMTELLESAKRIPMSDAQPLLATPLEVLEQRPDVMAAAADFAANSAAFRSARRSLLPSLSIRGFYGIEDTAFFTNATIWNVAADAAVSLIDFGRYQGRVDTAGSRETQAYELYRKAVLEAVAEVESALSDYAYLSQRYNSLNRAYKSADRAHQLAQTLYKEGEISYLDVLDAQRSANLAESAMVSSQASQMESLVRLYKSLGSY